MLLRSLAQLDTPTIAAISLAASALIACAIGFGQARRRRRLRRTLNLGFAATRPSAATRGKGFPHDTGATAELRAEIRAVHATLVALGRRFDDLERSLSVDARLQAGGRAAADGEAGFELGVRLARSGATPEELVSACGIRPDEAALLLRLHARAA